MIDKLQIQPVEFNGSLQEFLVALDRMTESKGRTRPPAKDPWWTSSEAIEEIKKQVELLNHEAPEGYVFGPNPEQPLTYGFWPNT